MVSQGVGQIPTAGEGRMPCAYVCHGGGPLPITSPEQQGKLSHHLRDVGQRIRQLKPKALLVVSAHWETPAVEVLEDERPALLFDYGGFGPASYALKHPAPGDPQLASEVAELLKASGVAAKTVTGRGWDHGVFVPLILMNEQADIPVVQVSLLRSLDPLQHLQLGKALAPLRDRGIFILGSGASCHNLSALRGGGGFDLAKASAEFHVWLKDAACKAEPEKRWSALQAWSQAPSAKLCHPREEHLLPLHVCAGAAGSDAGHVIYDEVLMGAEVVSLWYGEL